MKCKICGKRITPIKEKIYIASETGGLSEALSGGVKKYKCIDCDFCGCQTILQFYKEPIKEGNK